MTEHHRKKRSRTLTRIEEIRSHHEQANEKKDAAHGDSLAPFTDGKEAEPHYTDTIDPELIKPTSEAYAAQCGTLRSRSMKMPDNTTEKIKDLDTMRSNGMDQPLTSNLGVKIANDQNTLKAGSRGPSLLEDFHFLEKMAHFDQERIPERVVHARGSGAHGYFQVYKSLSKYTKAGFSAGFREKRPRSLCVFPPCRASEDLRIR